MELLSSISAVAKGLEKKREMVQKRLDEGFIKEKDDLTDDTGERRLVNAMLSMVTQKLNVRKRQASSASVIQGECAIQAVHCIPIDKTMPEKYNQIRLGKSVTLMDIQHLASMPKEEVKRCLPQLGVIGSWSQEAVNILAEKVKSVYPNVSSWSENTVAAAGSIIAGLTSAEIQQLSVLNSVDILHKVGKHGRLSTEQLKAGFPTWYKLRGKNDASMMTGAELSSISEFVCGLETTDISKLKDATFKKSLYTIGSSKACSLQQNQAYLGKAMAAYGAQANQWNPAIVADMGLLLGALSDEQIKILTTEQLALLTPRTIQMLPQNTIAAMTESQLMSLSTNQANAVIGAHYEALTAEQKQILNPKTSIAGTKQTVSSSDVRVPENGIAQAAPCGFFALITAAFILLLV